MGWFSANIMGGDEPFEEQAEILSLFGIEYPENDDIDPLSLLTKEILENKQAEVLAKMKEQKKATVITLQVLGVLILNKGAKFDPEVKAEVLRCLRLDEWAKVALDRKIYVDEMIDIIENYTADAPVMEYKEYPEIPKDEWYKGAYSFKVANIALGHFKKYCEQFPIIKSVALGTKNNSGYCLVLLIDDSDRDVTNAFMKNDGFSWKGLFDFSITVIFSSDFKAA